MALEVVDAHWAWQRGEWSAILAGPGTALERLRGIFDVTAQMQASALRGTGAVTGCLFGNLALEVSANNPSMQKRLQEIFDEQVQMIAEHLTVGVDAGEIEIADARMAAKSIVAQLEGLVLFAKLFNDPGELDDLWGNSLRLMGITLSAEESAPR